MERIDLRKLAFALVIVVACCGSARAQAKANQVATEEQAILDNVKQMESGWNTKSGSAFARPFAANADYVVINGTHLTGHDAIEKGHQRIFDTYLKDSILSLSTKQIRFLRPDVALVHVSGQLKNKEGSELRTNNVIITLVMTKERDEWRIAAFQNTAIEQRR